VITAFPAATPVTTPLADTVATALLLLLHDTFWFVAWDGVTDGIMSSVAPTSRLVDDFKDTPVTAMLVVLTVTAQVAVLLPSAVVTVIIAFPAATAVTVPLVDTVATAVLLLLHNTFGFVALDGVIPG
jgi:hypothetical protein